MFALPVVLGIHAYDSHMKEAVEVVSRRKWMYWFYAMVFLLASVANFVQLWMTVILRSYEYATFHLGYITLFLALSYIPLLAGASRKTYHR
jgi:hypothetical protein